MPRFSRMETLQAMYETGLVPVFSHSDPEVVIEVARACSRGGARLVEFTNRADRAYTVFRTLEQYCMRELPQLITGVGSIVDAQTAAIYVNDGANFIVGPGTNSEVARLCNRRKIPYSPGCGSLTEVSQAEELGCEIVKIFPAAEVGGPAFVKAVRGPCPWTSLMPTGGVDCTEESLGEWFRAGVACVGIGSRMITKELIASGDFDGVAERVAQTLAIIAQVKAENDGNS